MVRDIRDSWDDLVQTRIDTPAEIEMEAAWALETGERGFLDHNFWFELKFRIQDYYR